MLCLRVVLLLFALFGVMVCIVVAMGVVTVGGGICIAMAIVIVNVVVCGCCLLGW